MALHPSTRPISVSPPLGLSHDAGNNGLKINGFDSDPQDSFFADISSLSSSLMAKDGSSDAGDSRSLPMSLLSSKIKNPSQKLSSSSYDALLLGNMGAEVSSTLLSSQSQGDFQRAQMGAESIQPLRILKHPTIANSGLSAAEGMGMGMGIGGEDSEEAATLLAAQQERAQFPPEFIDKLVAVLKRYGSDGLLGSQFPEAYKKLHGEKLVLENKKGSGSVCSLTVITV
jgi:hypothetical protein